MSASATRQPRRASRLASGAPVGPLPTIQASKQSSLIAAKSMSLRLVASFPGVSTRHASDLTGPFRGPPLRGGTAGEPDRRGPRCHVQVPVTGSMQSPWWVGPTTFKPLACRSFLPGTSATMLSTSTGKMPGPHRRCRFPVGWDTAGHQACHVGMTYGAGTGRRDTWLTRCDNIHLTQRWNPSVLTFGRQGRTPMHRPLVGCNQVSSFCCAPCRCSPKLPPIENYFDIGWVRQPRSIGPLAYEEGRVVAQQFDSRALCRLALPENVANEAKAAVMPAIDREWRSQSPTCGGH
jgi:hypothetical protein